VGPLPIWAAFEQSAGELNGFKNVSCSKRAAGECGMRSTGDAMYPLVYWAGMATFLFWTALSAYSALQGL